MAITYLSGQRIQGLVEADGYIDFDGSSSGEGTGDYAKAGSNSDFNFLHEDNDWSLAFWIYLNATAGSSEPCPLATMGATASEYGICVHADTSNHLTFLQRPDGGQFIQQDFATLSNTTWYHVAITQNVSTDEQKFYLNGVDTNDDVDISSNVWGARNSTSALNFARNPRGSYPVLNCRISDVALWDNHVLSQADITKLAGGTAITDDGTGFDYSSGNITNHWSFFTDYTDSKGSLNASAGAGDPTFATAGSPVTSTYPSLPNGTIYNEIDAYKYFMFDGTDTWNQMVSS